MDIGSVKTMEESESISQLLTFVLSGDEFAVPIMKVKEIIEYRELTRVPMVPRFIAGAINLRGSVVPIVRLSTQFGLQEAPLTRRTCFVIIEVELGGEATSLGVLVDKVLQVVDIPSADVEPAPSLGTKIRTDFIAGMGRIGEQFVVILDIDRVLSAEEVAVVDSVGARNLARDLSQPLKGELEVASA